MSSRNSFKIILLFISDIAALYLALFAALIIRYGDNFYNRFTDSHLLPFTIVFVIWLIIFYIAGLYDLRRLRNSLEFLKTLGLTLFVNAIFAALFFYFIPAFGISPRRNLFIVLAIFAVVEIFWRRKFNRLISSGEAPSRVVFVDGSRAAETVYGTIKSNPQFGYEIVSRLTEENAYAHPEQFRKLALERKVNLIVIPRHLKNNPALAAVLYGLLAHGIEVHDLVYFYESVMRKMPIDELEEAWFLENLVNQQRFYDPLKRALELFFALLLAVALLPLELLIAALVTLTSPGPVIYKQVRAGKNSKEFTLYKFRTMKKDAEKHGVQWKASGTRDTRLTPVGGILAASHLDELPQLLNIIKGDLSFVGPRPERPEFVKLLKEKIPHYEIRHFVLPGITGWAQINYRYGASIEDSYEKLEYDIYYIKNRSIFLDLAIIIKTLRSFFVNQK